MFIQKIRNNQSFRWQTHVAWWERSWFDEISGWCALAALFLSCWFSCLQNIARNLLSWDRCWWDFALLPRRPCCANSTRPLLAFILNEQEIYVWFGTTHPFCGKITLQILSLENQSSCCTTVWAEKFIFKKSLVCEKVEKQTEESQTSWFEDVVWHLSVKGKDC